MISNNNMIEEVLKQHISTWDDIKNVIIIYFWIKNSIPLKNNFVLWYRNINKGSWNN